MGYALRLERVTFDVWDCFRTRALGEIDDELSLRGIAQNLDVLTAGGVADYDAVLQCTVFRPQNCRTSYEAPIVMRRNYEQLLGHLS